MNEVLVRLQAYYNSFLKAIPRIGLAVLILIIGILIANWVTSFFQKKIRQKSHDPLMSSFLAKAVKMTLIVAIFLLALNAAGLSGVAAALTATAGASAVVLGFAFKDIAQNFLAGVILAFNRPFHVEDTVQIEAVFGKVKSMEFRYTKIITFDGRTVYIPNSDVLTKPVFNYTEDGFFRTDFILGIAYENNAQQAKTIIQDCLDSNQELIQDDQHQNFVVEDEVAPSTVNLKVYIWISTVDFRRKMLQIRGRVITQTKTALESKGFNLPAEISELKFYDASSKFPVEVYFDKSLENNGKPGGE